jgi:pyrroline-5-carboxylate reductase
VYGLIKEVSKDRCSKIYHYIIFSFIRRCSCKSKKELKYLVKESQTPKGLNEQGLKEMSKKGVYKSVINTLNSIHKRLNK